jgi:threonine/homoserine/homoserine lactone efflux protein
VLIEAIGEFLPAAIGVAVSPVPIIAIVLVLGTSRARSNGPMFALGWVAGLAAVSTLVVLVVGAAGDDDAAGTSYWLKIAIGVLLLVMGAMQWRKRPRDGEDTEMPGWMATIDRVTPLKALGIGAALSGVNPKNFALTAAASASIAEVGLTGGDELIAIAVFVLIGSAVVVGAVIFYLIDADRAAGPLASVRGFMTQNNAVIMMVILVLLGASLVGDGVAGLQT